MAKQYGPDGVLEAAGGVIIDDAGRVAAIYRPHRNDWSLPKGHLDPGEDAEAGALREVFEETGLRCRIDSTGPEVRYVDGKGRDKRVRYFLMSVLDGEFRANDEATELVWLDDDLALLTYEVDRQLIADARRRPPKDRA
ncbi:MAG: NUDIX hydrolase [Microthrixaceae bacterium]|nr:NUDIX hydrolase [Microthrixaceae bacterium]MCO5314204.1 NUDIX hydrolase [Microthrixaceae bacterium]